MYFVIVVAATLCRMHTATTASCCPYGGIPLPITDGRRTPALIGLGIHKAATSYLFNVLKTDRSFKAPDNAKELYMWGKWPVKMDGLRDYLNRWREKDLQADAEGILYEV